MTELRGERITLRPAAVRDAPELLRMYTDNQEFFRPWDPTRPDNFYTLDRQQEIIHKELDDRRAGAREVFVILCDKQIVGHIAINDIVRGAFHSAHLGYSVAEAYNGRGFATEAVRLATGFAFRTLELHRLQAATVLRNLRSQRVLEKVGYRREGTALRYLKIAGVWEDHHLYAITAEEWR